MLEHVRLSVSSFATHIHLWPIYVVTFSSSFNCSLDCYICLLNPNKMDRVYFCNDISFPFIKRNLSPVVTKCLIRANIGSKRNALQ